MDNGVGLASARWPLYVSHRVLHGIVHSQKLIQIDLATQKGNGIFLPPDGTVQQIPEKCLDRHCLFPLVHHLDNSCVFPVEVQRNIHSQANDIGHVIYSHDLPGVPHDTIFDLLLVLLKISQKAIFLPVQIFPDALLVLPKTVFRTDGNLPGRS